MPDFVAIIFGGTAGGEGYATSTGIISNVVGFVSAVVGTYWIYFLGIALVIGLAGAFWKLAKLGR